MENTQGFTGITVRTAVQDFAGLIFGALATGTQENGQASVVIPATQATGNYYLIAKADNGNVASESNETNNVRSRTIKVN